MPDKNPYGGAENLRSWQSENTGPNGSINMDKPDDIIAPTKKKIGDYVHSITEKAHNNPTVSPGSQTIVSVDKLGYPAPLSTLENPDLQQTYMNSIVNNEEVKNIFKKISNSGLFGNFQIKKGKQNSVAPSGQEIYDDINNNGDRSEFAGRVQEVLLTNNRYNFNVQFANSNINSLRQAENVENNIALGNLNHIPGKYGPRTFPDVVTTSPNAELTIKDLKKVALLTMLEAGGEFWKPDPTQDIVTLTPEAANMPPGLARLGQKVPFSRFAPLTILNKIKPDVNKDPMHSYIPLKETFSYGNTNSYFAPFDGLTATASVSCAAILSLTVGLLIKGVSSLIALRTNSGPRINSNDTNDRARFLGSYNGNAPTANNPGFDTFVFLQTADTHFDYAACVSKGVNVFFGFEGNVADIIRRFGTKVTQTSGYMNVILRNVVRGAREVVGNAPQIYSDAREELNPDVESIRDTFDPINIIKRFNNSSLFKFINMMAMIGDAALKLESVTNQTNNTDLLSFIDSIREEAQLPYENNTSRPGLSPAILISKNKLNNGTLTIANSTIQSLFFVSSDEKTAANTYGQNQYRSYNNFINAVGNSNRVYNSSDTIPGTSRLKNEIVKAMEDYMEQDYMPFYFHDLRTNEILSFHAFIESINDSFEADYNETESYGRMGKVFTYKNTNRSISLSFKLLSTNPEDFDQMWYKFNKLVMMLFPQWTDGRRVEHGQNKFTQPFSQTPSASPLVRMRIGDLFKTNYSKFMVAKLFGISGDQSKFFLEGMTPSSPATNSSNSDQVNRGGFAERVQELRRNRQQNGFQSGDMVIIAYYASGYPAFPSQPITQATNLRNQSPNFSIRQLGIENPATTLINGSLANRVTLTEGTIGRVISPYEVVNQPGRGTIYLVALNDGRQILVSRQHLQLDPTDAVSSIVNSDSTANANTVASNQQSTLAQQGLNSEQVVNNFFADGNNSNSNTITANPIMRSFKSTEGRGIAGFIKSLKYDTENVTWVTDKFNARAPMMLKIDIDFAPIFDINPGLASNGSMIGPIFNVGNIMKEVNGKYDGYDQTEQKYVEAITRRNIPPFPGR